LRYVDHEDEYSTPVQLLISSNSDSLLLPPGIPVCKTPLREKAVRIHQRLQLYIAFHRCSEILGFAGVLLIESSRQRLRTTCIAAGHNDDSIIVLMVIHVLLSTLSTTLHPGAGYSCHLLSTSFDLHQRSLEQTSWIYHRYPCTSLLD
jgi:hypothetical protein